MKKKIILSITLGLASQIGAQDTLRTVTLPVVSVEEEVHQVPDMLSPDSVFWRYHRTGDLGRLLAASGNVHAMAYGPPGTAVMLRVNGTAPDHAMLTREGIPLQSASLGMADFSLIPAFFFDGVTGSGGQSTVLSHRGIGADISLQRRPSSTTAGVEAMTEVNSLRNRFFGLRWHQGKGRWKWDSRALYQELRNRFSYTDRYLIDRPLVVETRSRGEMAGLMQSVRYTDRRQELNVEGWLIDRSMQLPAQMGMTLRPDRSQSDQQGRIIVSHRLKLPNERSVLKTTAAAIGDHQVYQEVDANGQQTQYSATHGRQFHLSGQWQQRFGKFGRVEAGPHVQWVDVSYNERQPVGVNALAWAANVFRTSKHTSFGFRARREKRSDQAPVMSGWGYFSLLQLPLKFLSAVHVEAGKTVRLPDFNEVFWSPGGNPNLRPEQSFGGKLTIDFIKPQRAWSLQTQVYHFVIQDWIQWIPQPSGLWSPVNVKQVESTGADGMVSHHFRSGLFHFRSSLKYQWNKAIGRNARGDQPTFFMVYTPEHRSCAVIEMGFRNWNVLLTGRTHSKRYTDESNSSRLALEPFFVTDAALSREFNRSKSSVEVNFRVENVLNQRYELVRAFALPGRVFHLSILYHLHYEKTHK